MNEDRRIPTMVLTVRAIAACLTLASCLPAMDQQEAGIPAHTVTEGDPSRTMEIVIKFRDDGKIKTIIDCSRRDGCATQTAFEAFKLGRPEMAGATLVRVTYSHELVLAFEVAGPSRFGQVAAIRVIAARLTALPDVLYADPDLTVQAEAG